MWYTIGILGAAIILVVVVKAVLEAFAPIDSHDASRWDEE